MQVVSLGESRSGVDVSCRGKDSLCQVLLAMQDHHHYDTVCPSASG